jgi:hypothetical protein
MPEFETWGTLKVPIEIDAKIGTEWLDAEASIDKQYFMGMDIGFEKDTTIMAEGHVEDGKLVIDRIIQPKPELGKANQGL